MLLWLAPEPPTLYSGGSISLTHCFRELANAYDIIAICLPSNLLGDIDGLAVLPDNVKVRIFKRDSENKPLALLKGWVQKVPYKMVRNNCKDIERAIKDILQQYPISAVCVEHGYMAHFAWDLKVPRILNMHNIESKLAQSEMLLEKTILMRKLWKRESECWSNWEKRMVESFDHITVITHEDETELKSNIGSYCSEKVTVLERGTECLRNEKGLKESTYNMVFVGSMAYGPNIDAAVHFSEDIFPIIRLRLPQATFTIVGGNPSVKVQSLVRIPGIKVTGFVSDVGQFYDRASLVVIPMRTGGGVKMKLLEALGRGMPIVVTPAGAAGVKVTHQKEVFIAESDSQFVQHCVELLANPGLRRSLSSNAYQFARKNHSWEATGKKLIEIIEKTIYDYEQKYHVST
jgi:polysaccharide biosynthesis protein PslH